MEPRFGGGVVDEIGGLRRWDMETYMKTAFAALAFLLAASAAACNTVEGVGEDLTAAGQAIDQTADENK